VVNMWHAAWVAAQSAEAIRAELDTLARIGVRVLRITACSEGAPDAPLQVAPSLQPTPGVFDEAMAKALDVVLHELRVRGMRAILVLNNMWTWSGGFASYLVWARGADWRDIPYPSSHLANYWDGAGALPKRLDGTWDEYQNWTCAFYSDKRALMLAEAGVRFVLGRVNSLSGLAYAADPSVLAWELCNEPRAVSVRRKWQTRAAYMEWVRRTAALVKALAPEHLVIVGSEGKTPFESYVNVDFEATHALPDVDAITIHVRARAPTPPPPPARAFAREPARHRRAPRVRARRAAPSPQRATATSTRCDAMRSS
jgi:mannan endo-1,4-beta-mannosidase